MREALQRAHRARMHILDIMDAALPEQRILLVAHAGEQTAGDYEGSIQLFDRYGRVVYEGTGVSQCKST